SGLRQRWRGTSLLPFLSSRPRAPLALSRKRAPCPCGRSEAENSLMITARCPWPGGLPSSQNPAPWLFPRDEAFDVEHLHPPPIERSRRGPTGDRLAVSRLGTSTERSPQQGRQPQARHGQRDESSTRGVVRGVGSLLDHFVRPQQERRRDR